MSDYGSIPPPPPLPPPSPYDSAGAGGYPPPNYLVWAILSTVLFCLPFGIASIVFSTQVNTKWAMGDAAGAQAASGKAKKFAIWGAIIGVVLDILSVVFVIVVHGMGTQLNTGTGF
jgi:TRAP-type mannitol/chloroaromatic compound transport system permease small subunit